MKTPPAEVILRGCLVYARNSMKSLAVFTTITLLIVSLHSTPAMAASKSATVPSSKDKCPVCGMFVAKYPDWIAAAQTKDGVTFYFDGPKDLFTHYFNPGRYTPGKKQSDISGLSVKEYYSLKMIDAKSAFFVIGSDVYGPMGAELIPFASQKDAASFMNDHKGKRILRFGDITPQLLKDLK
jgi:nitrous oxide reductase accessory protein NosL